MLEPFFTALAANTIVLGVLGFLAKSIINHLLSKDISNFKMKLENTAKNEVAEFISNLEKERIRLQISYGGIFERQANTIIKIYNLVVDCENKVASYMTPTDEKAKVFSEFIESYKKLFNFYECNRVLLPADIEEHFEQLRSSIFKGVMTHKRVEEQLSKPHLLREQDFDKLFERQEKAYELIDKLPIIKKDLTNKLRTLIGVHQ